MTTWHPPAPDRPPVTAADRASPVPVATLDGCQAASLRLLRWVAAIDDEVARRPSVLPGWTVGHVLTHLARNADSHIGMVEGAARGEVVAQYPGGVEQRSAGIDAGAGRPAAELLADVAATVDRLEERWAALDAATWATGLGRPFPGPASLAHLAFLRWREVELHLADLGLADLGVADLGVADPGVGPDDPSRVTDAYLDAEWRETVARLAPRVPAGTSVLLVPGDRPSHLVGRDDVVVVARGEARDLLAWLTGRAVGEPGWPELGPWP